MKKRIIALLMTVIMLLGFMPEPVYAAPAVSDILAGLPFTANPGTGTTAWKGMDGGILQSGNKAKAYTTSTLTLTFTADTHLSFEYKVSCEATYDKFTITHGSTMLVNGVSGEIDWTMMELDAASGDVLTFAYKKDSSGDKGDDCVYLRNFSAGAPFVITFHNDGETVTQNIYGGSGTLRANSFTQTGKVFAGWAAAPEGEVLYSDGAAITMEADLDLYAVWSGAYTVTFDNNGSQSQAAVAQGYAIGAANIPAEPKRTGYTFAGWYHEDNRLDADTLITEDITYTAKWIPITYTVRFNANGGTGSMENLQAVYDADIILPDSSFTREGYTFRGWGTSSYSSAPTYQPEGIVKNLKNVQDSEQVLYAIWGGNPVNVTVDMNYKGAEVISRTGAVGQNYNYIREANGDTKFSSVADPKREGYNFKGWYDAPEGGNAITNQYKFTAEDAKAGVTLYAHWAESITITFDAGGGSCYTKEKKIDRGTSCGTLPGNSLSGKKFEGWYTEDGEKAENTTIFDKDTTLYARFRNYQVTVSFDANGGTGSMEPFICESGVPAKLPPCTLTRDGYIFVQWTSIKNPSSWQSPKYYVDEAEYSWSSSYNDSKVTLYAVWEKVAEPTPSGTLLEAANSLTGYFTPVYGKDENANEAAQAMLDANGFRNVTIAVKEAAVYDRDGGTASIDADGTIHYYFNPGMSGTGGVYFETTFVLTCNGASMEKTWNTHMNWDKEKASQRLRDEMNRIEVPSVVEAESELTTLPHYLIKEGVSQGDEPDQTFYNTYTNFDSWATITWSSTDSKVITVGKLPDYPLYAPYPVTVRQGNRDAQASLTAHIVWNSGDVEFYKVFTVTVKGDEEAVSLEEELQTKLDNALATVGLRDLATGEQLDPAHVTGDIQFPTTRDIKVDGKYQPVTITSSNPKVVKTWDTNNAASAVVYRPLPGEEPVNVILTMRITDKATNTVVSHAIPVTVEPLTQEEIDAELALMEQVKTHYFDGIRNGNHDPENITGDLQPFFQACSGEDGNLVWVYQASKKQGNGIIPVAMDGWYDTEQWRLFKSSNMDVITHENLLVTRQAEHKAVSVTSWLSSEAMGKYAEIYPEREEFQKLVNQPVTVDLIVRGTNPTSDKPEQKNLTVTFTLRDTEQEWLTAAVTDLPEGTTAWDVFAKVLKENGYTYQGSSYIRSVTRPDGTVLTEFDHGANSGWKYKINGISSSKVITQQVLEDGDAILFYYTDDYTKDKDENPGRPEEPPVIVEMPKVNGDDIYQVVGDSIAAQESFSYGMEWMVLGLVRSGREVPAGYYEQVVQYVRENIDAQGRLDPSKSTENSRLILSLTAAGYDVTNVGGHNLLKGLSDLNYVKKQGVNGPIWALIALDSNHYEIPTVDAGGVQTTREALIQCILDSGILDDSWLADSSSEGLDAPVVMAAERMIHRKGTQSRPDVEKIAMAIQALAPYYNSNEEVRAAVDQGIKYLSAWQQADGGYANEYNASAECNAQVIVALTALGIHPHTDTRFVKEGNSVIDALSKYYVPGTGFMHEAGQGVDGMATEQGYYALAAYNRFLNGQSSLWDMTDAKEAEPGHSNGTEQTEEGSAATGTDMKADTTAANGAEQNVGAEASAGAGKKETPATGDTVPVAGYGAAGVISMLMFAVLLFDRKKFRAEQKENKN